MMEVLLFSATIWTYFVTGLVVSVGFVETFPRLRKKKVLKWVVPAVLIAWPVLAPLLIWGWWKKKVKD